MRAILQDLRYAIRLLRKSPAFTTVAVITLALGIGANTAIFSVVNTVLLRPLPFPQPNQIVELLWGGPGGTNETISYPNFGDWRDRNHVFSHVAAVHGDSFGLKDPTGPTRVVGAWVTPDLFPLLGIKPLLGRTFTAAEDHINSPPVVVVSYELWRGRLRSDPRAIGSGLLIDNQRFAVIGVMPQGFEFPLGQHNSLWLPESRDIAIGHDLHADREAEYLIVIARLRPDVTLKHARADMHLLSQQLAAEYPRADANGWAVVENLHDVLVSDARAGLFILLGAVGCVLLIACTNVANLMLARTGVREREIVVRRALGASRSRIASHLLTESVTLSLLGGVLGLCIAAWAISPLIALSPSDMPGIHEVHIDFRVLTFTFLLSVTTGIVFGIAPALHHTHIDLSGGLKEGGRHGSSGAQRRSRSALIIVEFSVALMLLIVASLMIESLVRLRRVWPGFDAADVLTADVTLPTSRYPTEEQQRRFYRETLDNISVLPGTLNVGITTTLPLSGGGMGFGFRLENGERHSAAFDAVSPSYFTTLHVPLLRGRSFQNDDNERSAPVVIINASMARKFWPDGNPIGRHIFLGDSARPREIVGVRRVAAHTRSWHPAVARRTLVRRRPHGCR